jgi:hypothetical protein
MVEVVSVVDMMVVVFFQYWWYCCCEINHPEAMAFRWADNREERRRWWWILCVFSVIGNEIKD